MSHEDTQTEDAPISEREAPEPEWAEPESLLAAADPIEIDALERGRWHLGEHMCGAPTRCTPAVIETIRDLMARGNTIEASASAVGVHRSTLHRWLARGKEELDRMMREAEESGSEWVRANRREAPYALFCDVVTRARALAEIQAVATLRPDVNPGAPILERESVEDVKWWLERARRSSWGRKSVDQRIEIAAAPSGAPRIDPETIAAAGPEQLEEMYKALSGPGRERGEGAPSGSDILDQIDGGQ